MLAAAYFIKATPLRCQACDLEWQDHPGISMTCEQKEALYEALKALLPYCRPPEAKGIEENVDYFRVTKHAEQLLKDLA